MKKGKQLRGEKLLLAVKAELGRMAGLSPKECPINISSLAKRLNVSRQTLYSHGFAEVVSEFSELQKSNFDKDVESTVRRSSYEERVACLESENEKLRAKVDAYVETWVAVEYNARMLGIDPDELFKKIPRPSREIIRGSGR
ncbi:MAG: hypothetical protein V3573_02940 [Desulfovibrionaceae bacterium]